MLLNKRIMILFWITTLIHEASSYSIPLTESNWIPELETSEVGTIVLFYAGWSMHSKELMSTWEQVKNTFELNLDIKFTEVDCTGPEQFLCDKFKIFDYPHIKAFADNFEPIRYQGKHEFEELKKFAIDVEHKRVFQNKSNK